uniref:Uncharacterized protein n=1 Tax=Rhizophora mucronata TaxID=61149 RepID=A0A2P2J2Y4_RHIMU
MCYRLVSTVECGFHCYWCENSFPKFISNLVCYIDYVVMGCLHQWLDDG